MNIVDVFLNELQKRIEANNILINDFESKKNSLIEIRNILYKHEILKNEVDLTDFLKFTNEEIKIILQNTVKDKSESYFRAYLVYKSLVETYKTIKDKFKENFVAPQYNEATKWLNELIKRINEYLNSFEERNQDYISELKKVNDIYKYYFNLFIGGTLTKPICDFDRFYSLLDTMNFNDEEKAKIKKFIGISNIKLLSGSYNILDENVFSKYRVILKNKKKKYHELYIALKERDYKFADAEDIISELKLELKEDEYSIRQALCALFIEKELEKAANLENINTYDVIKKLDEIICFSHTVNEDMASEDDVTTEDIIKNAKEIIESEKELIESTDEDEFGKYLAQSLISDDKDIIKYKIVSILIALSTEIEKYYNVIDNNIVRNSILDNIREYIHAYKVLKNK